MDQRRLQALGRLLTQHHQMRISNAALSGGAPAVMKAKYRNLAMSISNKYYQAMSNENLLRIPVKIALHIEHIFLFFIIQVRDIGHFL